jgi:pimeloyl-ACP methyl ester carboxylesterase
MRLALLTPVLFLLTFLISPIDAASPVTKHRARSVSRARTAPRGTPSTVLKGRTLPRASLLNGDTGRTVHELIENRGYKLEDIPVITSDHYKLTLHRFANQKPGAPPVLLQHGLMDTSAAWLVNSKTHSLAYILFDAGYDVFLANSRGNKYSSLHESKTTKDPTFWQFTFDDHGLFDLPAFIDKALSINGAKSLTLIAHSQGATLSTIALSDPTLKTTLSPKVNLFVALAPVTFMTHHTSPLLQTLGKYHGDTILSKLTDKQFVPLPDQLNKIFGTACHVVPSVCQDAIASTLFGPTDHISKARMGVYMGHWPDRTSQRNMQHWITMAREGTFAKFDGKPVNVPSLSVPTLVYSGKTDYLAGPQDIKTLIQKLGSNVIDHQELNYGHMDFVWAEDAATLLYPRILKFVKQHSGSTQSPRSLPKSGGGKNKKTLGAKKLNEDAIADFAQYEGVGDYGDEEDDDDQIDDLDDIDDIDEVDEVDEVDDFDDIDHDDNDQQIDEIQDADDADEIEVDDEIRPEY